MIRPWTMLLLVAPLLLSAQQVSAETIEKEEMAQELAIMLRGRGQAHEFGPTSNEFGYGYGYEYGLDEMQHGRKLSGWGSWSWGNLLCTFNSCKATRSLLTLRRLM
jgi:hypothetical protein